MFAYAFQRGQAVFVNRAPDGVFCYAVASADLRVIRQGCNGCSRVLGSAFRKTGAEYHVIANAGNIRLVLDHLEVPSHGGSIPIENGSNQVVAFNDQPPVYSLIRIAQYDLLPIVAIGKITGGIQINTRHL